MSRAQIQSSNVEQMQNDVFECQDNGERYSMVNNIPLRLSNEMLHDQLLAYYNATAHLINFNYG
jgi:hypothetical protein